MSGSYVDAPRNTHFYDLRSMGEQENSPGVVNGTLKVLYLNVYTLL